MTNFKLNDVVIVTKNPPNQFVKIKGDIGYIDEFQEATNEKGEVVKYVYFKTIELHSFLGGMGSIPIDCIELCDNPVYLKRFQEILEHQRKEQSKDDLIQAYCKLERDLKDKDANLILLKNLHKLLVDQYSELKSDLNENGKIRFSKTIDDFENDIIQTENMILKIKGEMNTSINKQVNWYLQNLRYG